MAIKYLMYDLGYPLKISFYFIIGVKCLLDIKADDELSNAGECEDQLVERKVAQTKNEPIRAHSF